MRALPRTHKVTISRTSSTTRVKGGGRVPNNTPVASDVDCNLQPRRGDLRQSPSGLSLESTHMGFFEPGTDVQQDDLIAVTEGDYYPTNFRVEHVGVQGGEWDVEVELEEDRQG